MAKPSAAAGPADKGTLVRPRFRRRAQRAWAVGATAVARGTRLALLARKAGGTERPERAGSGLPDRDTDGASATAWPGFACVRAGACRVRPVASTAGDPRRAGEGEDRRSPTRRQRCRRAGAPARALSPCARVGTGSPGLGGRRRRGVGFGRLAENY